MLHMNFLFLLFLKKKKKYFVVVGFGFCCCCFSVLFDVLLGGCNVRVFVFRRFTLHGFAF